MKKIFFLGDINIKNQIKIDKKIINLLKTGDLVVANLEGPILMDKDVLSSDHFYSINKHIIKYLKILNVNLVIVGNNHIIDYGISKAKKTIEILKKNKINYVGFHKKYISLKNIFIISYTHKEKKQKVCKKNGPFHLDSISKIKDIIKKNKKNKFCIFNYHGGEEYFKNPWPRRVFYYSYLLKLNFNLVLGQQAHVIQKSYMINQNCMAPSTGNFYFYNKSINRKIPNTKYGSILEVNIEKNLFFTHKIRANYEKNKLYYYGNKKLVQGNFNYKSIVNKWNKECLEKLLFKNIRGSNKLINFLRSIKLTLKAFTFRDKIKTDVFFSSLPLINKIFFKKKYKEKYKFDY